MKSIESLVSLSAKVDFECRVSEICTLKMTRITLWWYDHISVAILQKLFLKKNSFDLQSLNRKIPVPPTRFLWTLQPLLLIHMCHQLITINFIITFTMKWPQNRAREPLSNCWLLSWNVMGSIIVFCLSSLCFKDSSSDQSVSEAGEGGASHWTDGLFSEGDRKEYLFAPIQWLPATFTTKRVSRQACHARKIHCQHY